MRFLLLVLVIIGFMSYNGFTQNEFNHKDFLGFDVCKDDINEIKKFAKENHFKYKMVYKEDEENRSGFDNDFLWLELSGIKKLDSTHIIKDFREIETDGIDNNIIFYDQTDVNIMIDFLHKKSNKVALKKNKHHKKHHDRVVAAK